LERSFSAFRRSVLLNDDNCIPRNMKHDPYSLTELIRNEAFIAWVMHPDELSDRKWRAFPGKASRETQNRRVCAGVRYPVGKRYRQTSAQPEAERSNVEHRRKPNARGCAESARTGTCNAACSDENCFRMEMGEGSSFGGSDIEHWIGELLVLL
jgi:hypothetical protein